MAASRPVQVLQRHEHQICRLLVPSVPRCCNLGGRHGLGHVQVKLPRRGPRLRGAVLTRRRRHEARVRMPIVLEHVPVRALRPERARHLRVESATLARAHGLRPLTLRLLSSNRSRWPPATRGKHAESDLLTAHCHDVQPPAAQSGAAGAQRRCSASTSRRARPCLRSRGGARRCRAGGRPSAEDESASVGLRGGSTVGKGRVANREAPGAGDIMAPGGPR